MNKTGFIKAFKKAIPNFDETLCHYEFKKYNEVKIKFVLNGKLVCLKTYKDQYYIDLWKNHFIEYFNTGVFDYNGYWKIYNCRKLKDGSLEDFFIDDNVYKIPLCKEFENDFYEHSKELEALYRIKHKDLGIKLIPKPINNKNIIEFDEQGKIKLI